MTLNSKVIEHSILRKTSSEEGIQISDIKHCLGKDLD